MSTSIEPKFPHNVDGLEICLLTESHLGKKGDLVCVSPSEARKLVQKNLALYTGNPAGVGVAEHK